MFPNAFMQLGSSGSAAGSVLMLLYLVPILSYCVFCVPPWVSVDMSTKLMIIANARDELESLVR